MWVQDLSIYGTKGYVYKDVNKLVELSAKSPSAVVNRNTVFNTNGSIAITQIVYKDDGAVLMQTTTTTIFNADGSITEEVVS